MSHPPLKFEVSDSGCPETPLTLSIQVQLHVDLDRDEDPETIAQEVVEQYQTHLEYGGIVGRCDYVTPFLVMSPATLTEPQWIDIADHAPTEDGMYVVQAWTQFLHVREFLNGAWVGGDPGTCYAWLPLPKPLHVNIDAIER